MPASCSVPRRSSAVFSSALSIVLSLVVSFAVAPGSASADDHGNDASVYVSVEETKEWLSKDPAPLFLDVREKDEFKAGHLPGALNILYTDVTGMTDQLPKDRPIVTYCIHSAHRAPQAAATLRKLGFTNAYVMEGGIVAWEAGGQTIEASSPGQSAGILEKSDRCQIVPKPES